MKTLKLNEMENVQGGMSWEWECLLNYYAAGGGAGASMGMITGSFYC